MKRLLIASACLTLWLVSLWGTTLADDWKPIDPAHMAQKTPSVDPNADAEIIFWEVRVDDSTADLVYNHYVRLKIFSERGKEKHGQVEIKYVNPIRIIDIAGRTIKPDGTIVELKKDAIFDRTDVKVSDVKLKTKAFAMPSVEVGSIIEYRWKEVQEERSANYVRLNMQREIPIQRVTYFLKPAEYPGYGMRAQMFNGNFQPFQKEKGGFYSTSMTNVPALQTESRMPPEDNVKRWMLVYYSNTDKPDPAKFWNDFGKRIFDVTKSYTKVNDEVRAAATQAIGDATTPDQKLERLYRFCQTRIRNVSDDASRLTPEERKRMKDNKNPSDTLKRGYGTGEDIDLLFASLATAAGFPGRLALIASRGRNFFDPSFADAYFLRSYVVAVQVGAEWRFYDPGVEHVEFGMLRWQEEGMQALIPDSKEPRFVVTPISDAKRSRAKRTGKFKLDESGMLEGDMRVEYTGHLARSRREALDDEAQAAREKYFESEVRSRMGAEVTDLKIENFDDATKPLTVSCHVRVPGYAKRTGKRLFIPVSFFQYGVAAMFADERRQNPIYFEYPWSEDDDVAISIPEGFDLDNAESPASFPISGDYGNYAAKASFDQKSRAIVYQRQFHFGKTNEIMLFPTSTYSVLRTIFGEVHKQDEHAITLKVK
jgi:hypothetical protein